MPLLVMPSYPETLIDQTCRAAVRRQIEYGRQRGVPWGISESGYNLTDANLNYQYRAFGVPGLGYKRGLGEDLVVAPYATALALLVLPSEATGNLQTMQDAGFAGRYGYYEAADYTPSRLSRGQEVAVVRSFMVAPPGYVAPRSACGPRSSADAAAVPGRARGPCHRPAAPGAGAEGDPVLPARHQDGRPGAAGRRGRVHDADFLDAGPPPARGPPALERPVPRDGKQCRSGYSRWRDIEVTRWHEDPVADGYGVFCYIRDVESGVSGRPATSRRSSRPRRYKAIFQQAGPSSGDATTSSTSTPSAWSRPRTTSSSTRCRISEPLLARAQSSNQLRRGRDRPRRARRFPPGLLEPLRDDRAPPRPERDPRDPPPALLGQTPPLPHPHHGRRRPARPVDLVRDRPGSGSSAGAETSRTRSRWSTGRSSRTPRFGS